MAGTGLCTTWTALPRNRHLPGETPRGAGCHNIYYRTSASPTSAFRRTLRTDGRRPPAGVGWQPVHQRRPARPVGAAETGAGGAGRTGAEAGSATTSRQMPHPPLQEVADNLQRESCDQTRPQPLMIFEPPVSGGNHPKPDFRTLPNTTQRPTSRLRAENFRPHTGRPTAPRIGSGGWVRTSDGVARSYANGPPDPNGSTQVRGLLSAR